MISLLLLSLFVDLIKHFSQKFHHLFMAENFVNIGFGKFEEMRTLPGHGLIKQIPKSVESPKQKFPRS